MKIALLSDIHGNREAFAAVLDDAARRGVSRYVILGDIVGYGPDPVWCVERALALQAEGALVIQGNHDAAIDGTGADMNPVARAAIDWTRARLLPDQRAWLAALPLTLSEDGMLFTHASAHSPQDWIYITSERGAMASFRASPARLIFCGHVHIPALYSYDRGGRTAGHLVKPGATLPLLASRRWLAVAGSVGQPRDGCPHAGWLLLDAATDELSFRRTPYDCTATAAKIRSSGLVEPVAAALAERLMEGR